MKGGVGIPTDEGIVEAKMKDKKVYSKEIVSFDVEFTITGLLTLPFFTENWESFAGKFVTSSKFTLTIQRELNETLVVSQTLSCSHEDYDMLRKELCEISRYDGSKIEIRGTLPPVEYM